MTQIGRIARIFIFVAGCSALVFGCGGPAADPTEVGIKGQDAARLPGLTVPPLERFPTLALSTPTIAGLLPIEPPGTLSADPAPVSPARATETGKVPTPEAQVCSPLAGISLEELPQIVSEPYHPPPPGREERHQGVDFSYYRRGERLSIQGAGVQAVYPGVVALVLEDKFPYGNMVIIETPLADLLAPLIELTGIQDGEAVYTLYAHLESAPLVVAGERVEACAELGAVGKSGNAGVAHLHLEMRRGPAGSTLAVMSYYIPGATEEEKASYLRWRISGEFNHFDPMLVLRH